MSAKTKIPLTIAGFDPSSGAGLTTDLATLQHFGLKGLAVCTAITYQNNNHFKGIDWLASQKIIEQITVLNQEFDFEFIKIGLIENGDSLLKVIVFLLDRNPNIKIIWDPILSASSGFDFHVEKGIQNLEKILAKTWLITPNKKEAKKLFGILNEKKLQKISSDYQTNILVKSFKDNETSISDLLIHQNLTQIIDCQKIKSSIHGSGCKLSSAILAHLFKGKELVESCQLAQDYLKNLLLKAKI